MTYCTSTDIVESNRRNCCTLVPWYTSIRATFAVQELQPAVLLALDIAASITFFAADFSLAFNTMMDGNPEKPIKSDKDV